MNQKILVIGQRTDQKKNIFSGQSMMFDALIEYLIEQKKDVSIINLTSKYQKICVGKIYLKRIFEYQFIIIKSLPLFFANRKGLLYLTTAQTKGGFVRDVIFIGLARMLKYKILLQQFGSNFESFYNSLTPKYQKMVVKMFNLASHIIVEGQFTKNQFSMIDNFENKVIPITNGLPEKNIMQVNDGKFYNNNESFNLIFLSYLIESKGYWDVLEAVNILKNQFNLNITCTFSGIFKPSVDDEKYLDAQEAEFEFKRYIDNNRLNNIVFYHQGLMMDEKANAFLKSHVFLLPSYFKFEGQPVSVLEAMAYGSVPIVTKYRMIPEMVTEDTGIFVEKKSPMQIALSIKYLMENKQIYHNKSQANIDRYKKYFTLEKYCSKINDLIKEYSEN